jgi:hypothetical protein
MVTGMSSYRADQNSSWAEFQNDRRYTLFHTVQSRSRAGCRETLVRGIVLR